MFPHVLKEALQVQQDSCSDPTPCRSSQRQFVVLWRGSSLVQAEGLYLLVQGAQVMCSPLFCPLRRGGCGGEGVCKGRNPQHS